MPSLGSGYFSSRKLTKSAESVYHLSASRSLTTGTDPFSLTSNNLLSCIVQQEAVAEKLSLLWSSACISCRVTFEARWSALVAAERESALLVLKDTRLGKLSSKASWSTVRARENYRKRVLMSLAR